MMSASQVARRPQLRLPMHLLMVPRQAPLSCQLSRMLVWPASLVTRRPQLQQIPLLVRFPQQQRQQQQMLRSKTTPRARVKDRQPLPGPRWSKQELQTKTLRGLRLSQLHRNCRLAAIKLGVSSATGGVVFRMDRVNDDSRGHRLCPISLLPLISMLLNRCCIFTSERASADLS